jgi:hypothetical protein
VDSDLAGQNDDIDFDKVDDMAYDNDDNENDDPEEGAYDEEENFSDENRPEFEEQNSQNGYSQVLQDEEEKEDAKYSGNFMQSNGKRMKQKAKKSRSRKSKQIELDMGGDRMTPNREEEAYKEVVIDYQMRRPTKNVIIEIRNVQKTYLLGAEGVPALRGTSF